MTLTDRTLLLVWRLLYPCPYRPWVPAGVPRSRARLVRLAAYLEGRAVR